MASHYKTEPVFFSPKKGLLNVRLPKKVVTQAFKKLYKKGEVVRITHQDDSGDTSVLFMKGSHKKVEKVLEKLKDQHFKKSVKSKDKKSDKKK